MTGPIELGTVAAAMQPKSASIEMTITRADGTVEHRSVTTTFRANGSSAETVESFATPEN